MRSLIIFSASLFLMAFCPGGEGSGDCLGYAFMEKGVTLIYRDYNAKEKLVGSHESTITDLLVSEGVVQATVHGLSRDEKDNVIQEGDYGFSCKDGVITMDMRSMAGGAADAVKDMEVSIDQSDLIFPASLTEGELLPDGKMTMSMSSNGMVVMTIVTEVVERKVEKFESITTAAGTFDCVRISQVMKTDMGMMKTTSRQTAWYSSGIGMVRSENFKSNGELQSYTVLDQIQR